MVQSERKCALRKGHPLDAVGDYLGSCSRRAWHHPPSRTHCLPPPLLLSALQLRARIAVQTVHPADVMRMNQEK